FQAEDGIRDKLVTGVQTCALPILGAVLSMPEPAVRETNAPHSLEAERVLLGSILLDNGALNVAEGIVSRDDFFSPDHRVIFGKRSEERRVGKECKWRGWRHVEKER